MKLVWCALLLAILSPPVHAVSGTVLLNRGQSSSRRAASSSRGDRTITEVVGMLEEMLTKVKAEAESDRTAYAEYKCYCDDTEKAKRDSIATLTHQIEMYENDIQEMQGANGRLSQELAKLETDISANLQSQGDATSVRDKEKLAFEAEEQDLGAAIGQMTQAIEILEAIGADQTLQSAADHQKYMAGKGQSLVRLRSSMKQALLAAKAFLKPEQSRLVEAFLQQRVPFTGTYTAQSANIVGILKQMKDTFEANLAAAKTNEEAQKTAYSSFIQTAQQAHGEMVKARDAKQGSMGDNDADLSTLKLQLSSAKTAKADDEAFLETLLPMCSDKAKEYDARKLYRANEQAAISQAIAILNSDQAFRVFGTVSATKSGPTGPTNFLQLSRAAASGMMKNDEEVTASSKAAAVAKVVAETLRLAAQRDGSRRLLRLALLVRSGNPFDKVLAEINKMLDLLVKEGEVDQKQFDWCKKERGATQDALDEKDGIKQGLESAIDSLDSSINNPDTGLLVQISNLEEALATNRESQATETKLRKEENAAYQQDAANIEEARALLAEAIRILTNFYQQEGAEQSADGSVSLAQEKPSPPPTWDDAPGQIDSGNSVIQMLKYIYDNAEKEGNTAHKAEETAQHAYEDSMSALKTSESSDVVDLAKAQEALADARLALEGKHEELHTTEKEITTLERYMESIRPGCDFITTNLATRNSYREEEETALRNAIQLLEATPAFKAAEAQEEKESYGSCYAKCIDNNAHVSCKACMAKVSIPGYCAGHPSTPGCSS